MHDLLNQKAMLERLMSGVEANQVFSFGEVHKAWQRMREMVQAELDEVNKAIEEAIAKEDVEKDNLQYRMEHGDYEDSDEWPVIGRPRK